MFGDPQSLRVVAQLGDVAVVPYAFSHARRVILDEMDPWQPAVRIPEVGVLTALAAAEPTYLRLEVDCGCGVTHRQTISVEGVVDLPQRGGPTGRSLLEFNQCSAVLRDGRRGSGGNS